MPIDICMYRFWSIYLSIYIFMGFAGFPHPSKVSRFRRPLKRSKGSKYGKLTDIKAQARKLGWCEAKDGDEDSDESC